MHLSSSSSSARTELLSATVASPPLPVTAAMYVPSAAPQFRLMAAVPVRPAATRLALACRFRAARSAAKLLHGPL